MPRPPRPPRLPLPHPFRSRNPCAAKLALQASQDRNWWGSANLKQLISTYLTLLTELCTLSSCPVKFKGDNSCRKRMQCNKADNCKMILFSKGRGATHCTAERASYHIVILLRRDIKSIMLPGGLVLASPQLFGLRRPSVSRCYINTTFLQCNPASHTSIHTMHCIFFNLLQAACTSASPRIYASSYISCSSEKEYHPSICKAAESSVNGC